MSARPYLVVIAGRPVRHISPDLRHRAPARVPLILRATRAAGLAARLTLALALAWLLVAALFSLDLAPLPGAANDAHYGSAPR